MYQEILDQIVWSFSSVNSYCNCPRGFYLRRIEHVHTTGNAFAEWGTFMHSLLERFFKGEEDFFNLSFIYMDDYKKNIHFKFPDNRYVDLNESYYNAGMEYLNSFEGIDPKYEVVSVEEKCLMQFGRYPFIGFIDLVLKDTTDGELVIWDHKSKSKFTSKRELKEYLRQLYLYAGYVKKKYGEFPKSLTFNMFRAGEIVETPFDPAAYDEAVSWFTGTIDEIYAQKAFLDKIAIAYYAKMKDIADFKKDDFFCNQLCDCRESCARSACYKGDSKQKERKRTTKRTSARKGR